MKRFLCLLLAVLMLCACAAPAEETQPTTLATKPTTEPTTTPTEPQWTPYTGKLRNYVYYYEEGRDREWEEDILHIAEVFLGEVYANGHPILTDMEFQTMFSMDGAPVEYRTFYDDAQRTEFIQAINDLIPQIPELEDYEILYYLQKQVAKLRDLHSSVGIWDLTETAFPLTLNAFYTDSGPEIRATVVPMQRQNVLYARLTAINGVPLEELITKLSAYISYENQYALMEDVCWLLTYAEPLDVIGVMELEDKQARFEFETDDGEHFSIVLDAVSDGSFARFHLTGQNLYSMDSPLVRREDVDYWWEYDEDSRMLYVRFNSIHEDYYGLNYSAFINELRRHIKDVPKTKTVVVDLRYNPGGQFHASLTHYLSSFLNSLEKQKSYVLIDSNSYSSAIWLPSNLMQMTENTVFVGSPGGQPANFFASVYDYQMPNSGYGFRMSDSLWVTNPDDIGDALMPDILLNQTLEDWIDGKDTVLEAIRRGKLPASSN